MRMIRSIGFFFCCYIVFSVNVFGVGMFLKIISNIFYM